MWNHRLSIGLSVVFFAFSNLVQADDARQILQDAASSMRLASGFHVEAQFYDGGTIVTLSGDIAGDDYDLALDSGVRTCKVNSAFWNSQDSGAHWQTAAVDDQYYQFVKSALRPSMRDAAGNQLDASRFVIVPATAATDPSINCIEVWIDSIPVTSTGSIPDDAELPHYWIKSAEDGKKLVVRVRCKLLFQGRQGTVDLSLSKINEISLIQPPSGGETRAPYIVTTPSANVVVITVPGPKDATPKTAETNSQLQHDPASTTSARENTLGLKFVPAGTPGVLFCIYDTRVKDFRAFVEATGYKVDTGYGTTPKYTQTDYDPVVKVDWTDAKAFCTWLTTKEKQDGKLGPDEYYRLPTDSEWSTAVELHEDSGQFPHDNDGKVKGFYPWGTEWPPPKGAGNYDESISHDGYEFSSPVGTFLPNKFGLYDMGGNVQQWCEDRWGNEDITACYYVTRGVSYMANTSDWCEAASRGNGNAGLSEDTGFRLVLSSHSEVKLQEYQDTVKRNVQAEFTLIWQSEEEEASKWSAHFAPECSYCYKDDGPASVAFVQSDREKLIKEWPDRTYALTGDPQFEIAPDQDAVVIRFSYTYHYIHPGKLARGTANTTLHLKTFPNGKWLITQFDEKLETTPSASTASKAGNESVIGKWDEKGGSFTFNQDGTSTYSDGTPYFSSDRGTWSQTGMTITLNHFDNIYTLKLSSDGKTLDGTWKSLDPNSEPGAGTISLMRE